MLRGWSEARQTLAVMLALAWCCPSASHAAGPDLDSLARRFRIRIYHSFRTDRSEYDRRLRQAESVLQAWRSRGAPDHEVALIADWFEQAIEASRPNASVSMPIYEGPGANRDPAASKRKSADPGATRPRVVEPAGPRRRKASPEVTPTNPTLPRQVEPSWTPNRRVTSSDHDLPPTTMRLEATVPTPPDHPQDLASSPVPPRTLDYRRKRQRRETPRVSVTNPAAPPRTDERRWPPDRVAQSADEKMPLSTMRLESLVPMSPDDVRRFAGSPVPHATLELEQRDTTQVENSGGSGGDPIDDVFGSPATPRQTPIDLKVLAARIRATNLRLSELESELSQTGLWDANRLESLVQQFDRIYQGQRLSKLYYDALNETERLRMTTVFASHRRVLDLLSQRWFEARVAAADQALPAVEQRESERLKSISKTIETWKTENPGYRN